MPESAILSCLALCTSLTVRVGLKPASCYCPGYFQGCFLPSLRVWLQRAAAGAVRGSAAFPQAQEQILLPLGDLQAEPNHTDHRKVESRSQLDQDPWLGPAMLLEPGALERVLRLVVAAAELLGAKTVVFCVCNKAVSPVSWPSELLPAWHFIINTFFSFLVLVSCHFIAFKVLFLFYSSLPIDRKYPGFSKQQRQT